MLKRFLKYFKSDKSIKPIKPIKPIKLTGHTKDIIPRKIRNQVWLKYHGNSNIGICYCCGITINRYNKGWHCSHVISDIKGGEEKIENLRTCCPHCNLSMGDQNLYTYMLEKSMKGPGSDNINNYFSKHPEQRNDKRTTNKINHS